MGSRAKGQVRALRRAAVASVAVLSGVIGSVVGVPKFMPGSLLSPVQAAASTTTQALPGPSSGLWSMAGSATQSGSSLQLTGSVPNETGAAFYPKPVNGHDVNASFTSDIGGGTGGNGLSLVIANAQTTKLPAIGTGGDGLGATGTNSVMVSLSNHMDSTGSSTNFVGVAGNQTAVPRYNNIGISNIGSTADFDFTGGAYLASELATAGLTPGGSMAADGFTFTWPNVPTGTPDNYQAVGQTLRIDVPAGTSEIGILGAATNGGGSGTVTIHYADGTSTTDTLSLPAWCSAATPPAGVVVAATMPDRSEPTTVQSSGEQATTNHVYATSLAVDSSKTVTAITLPTTTTGGQLHVFDIAAGTGDALGAQASVYNNVATNTDAWTANYDGLGDGYSSAALAQAGIVPGGSVAAGGFTFTWPSAQPGSADNYEASGQIIPLNLPAGTSSIGVLGAATNGAASGSATIEYADGSTSTATLSFPDWSSTSAPPAGTVVAATMPYRLIPYATQATTNYVYATSIAVDSSKTVTAIVLPSSTSGGQIHVFDIAAPSGEGIAPKTIEPSYSATSDVTTVSGSNTVQVATTSSGLSVSFNGHHVLSWTGSIPADAYVGFTGATGTLTDTHSVNAVSISAPLASPPLVDVPAPTSGAWELGGNAQATAAGLQLTTPATGESGSAFWPTPVYGQGISATFDTNMYGGSGADGIAFVIASAQDTTMPPSGLGNGGSIGAIPINAIVVTLDSYQNASEPSSSFVGVAVDPATKTITTPNYVATADVPDVRGAHVVQVTTTSSGLTVQLDGTTVLTWAGPLPTDAYIGFTGATGLGTDYHIVSDTNLTVAPVPASAMIPPPAATGGGSHFGVCPCQRSATKNPVNTATGNFWHTFTGLSVPGRGPALDFGFTYNSVDAAASNTLGFGWSNSYGMSLTETATTSPPTATVVEEDGSRVVFDQTPAGNWAAPAYAPRVSLAENANGTWTFARNESETFQFNATGQLTSITDRNGYTTTLTYGSGTVMITGPSGRHLVEDLGSAGQITSVSGPPPTAGAAAPSVSFTYNGDGTLASYTNADGGVTSFTYAPSSHLLLSMRLPTAQGSTTTSPPPVVTNTYNSAGQVVSQTDQLGRTTTFSYANGPNNEETTTVTDPAGASTIDTYQDGALISETTAAGTPQAATTTWVNDPLTLEPLTMTDPMGGVTTYTYNSLGEPLTTTDPLGRTTSRTYNSLGEPLTTTNAGGVTTIDTYDASGNLLSSATPMLASSRSAPAAGAPLITTEPSPQSAVVGQTAAFTAAAVGVPTPTVQWQYLSNRVLRWTDATAPSATSLTLVATAVTNELTSDLRYRAVFTNSAGSTATSPVDFTANVAGSAGSPVISTQPSPRSAVVGQTALFTAAASGTPAPTVQWQYLSNRVSAWTNVSGATSLTLTATAATSDVGSDLRYRAVFTNSAGTTATDAVPFTVAPSATSGSSASRYQQAVLADSPVAFWQLGGASGTTAIDSSRNGRTGTYSGGYTLGVSGPVPGGPTSTSFDGTSGAMTYTPSTTLAGAYSVEQWVYLPAGSPGGKSFGTRAPSEYSFDIQVTPNGLHVDIGTGSSWLTTSANYSGPISTDTWHLIDITVSSSGWDEYVDGGLVASGGFSGTPLLWDPSHVVHVAWSGFGTDPYFDGRLADVAVYPSTLSAAQVSSHYTTATASAAARTTTYTYGNSAFPGEVTAITNPDGNTTTFTYDAYGDVASATNAAGDTTTFTYNADGQLTSKTEPNGNVSGANPAKWTTTYTYDPMGHLLTTVDPNGHGTTRTYDANGNLTSVTNANGKTTSYTYDAANELVATHFPNGTSTSTTYTPDGQVASTTNAGGRVTTHAYNAAGELVSTTNPDGETTSYTYDLNGDRTTTTDPSGRVTTVAHDADGEPTSIAYSSGTAANVTAISYNANGERTSMTDGTGTSTWAYNSLGELTSQTNGAGATVSYGYDLNGNQTQLTYPGSAGTITRAYNAAGEMSSVTDWFGQKTSFTYDANGNLLSSSTPTTTDTATYTNLNQPASIAFSSSSAANPGTYATISYAYDPASNLTATATTGLPGPGSDTYLYTSLNQLAGVAPTGTGATGPSGSYTYDPVGNLTQLPASTVQTTGSGGTTLTSTATTLAAYGPASELCWTAPLTGTASTTPSCGSPPSGATTFTYNPEGQRTGATLTGTASTLTGTASTTTSTTYAWNQPGELTSVLTSTAGTITGTATTMTYDGTGLRASLTSPSSSGGTITNNFAYDESGSVPQILSDGQDLYLWGPAGLLEQVPIGATKGDVLFAHTDALGSVRALTNGTGTIVAMKTFGPYGKLVASSGTAKTRIGFAGAYTDPDGLLYLINRYYEPATGQFLSVDPLLALTQEPYAYAGGNPLGAIDPNGLDCGLFSAVCATYDAAAGGVKDAAYHVGRGVGNYYDTTTSFYGKHWRGTVQIIGVAGSMVAISTGVGVMLVPEDEVLFGYDAATWTAVSAGAGAVSSASDVPSCVVDSGTNQALACAGAATGFASSGVAMRGLRLANVISEAEKAGSTVSTAQYLAREGMSAGTFAAGTAGSFMDDGMDLNAMGAAPCG